MRSAQIWASPPWPKQAGPSSNYVLGEIADGQVASVIDEQRHLLPTSKPKANFALLIALGVGALGAVLVARKFARKP